MRCLILTLFGYEDNTLNAIPEKNRHRVRIFNKIPREEVLLLINLCVCHLCLWL